MKKTLTLILLCFAFTTKASTNISTSAVSGHWTLAGSPYLVFNDISIDGGQSLTIDPGVSVIFQGSYTINVYGALIAAGTGSQPIRFNVDDTSGWWDNTVATGGWHGIQFQPFGGSGVDLT